MSHQRATQGKGGGLHFRTSPSWSSSAAFVFFDVGVHTGLFCSWSSRKVVVDTTTEGGMAQFRIRFRVCSMFRTKIGPPKKLKKLHF